MRWVGRMPVLIAVAVVVSACTHGTGPHEGRSVPKDSGQSRVFKGVTQSLQPPLGANPGHSLLCIGSRLNDKDAICAPIEYAPNVSPSKVFLFKSDGGERITARLVRNRGLVWQPLLLNGKPLPS